MIEKNNKIQLLLLLLLFLMLRRLTLIMVYAFNNPSSLMTIGSSWIRSSNNNSNSNNINCMLYKTKRKSRMEMTVGLVSRVALLIKNQKISKHRITIKIMQNNNNKKKKMMFKKNSDYQHPLHQIKSSQLTILCRFILTKDIFEKWELTLGKI